MRLIYEVDIVLASAVTSAVDILDKYSFNLALPYYTMLYFEYEEY